MDTVQALTSSRPPRYDGQDHKASWGRRYPLKGQGVLLFNLTRSTPFTISISPVEPCKHQATPGYLALHICEDEAKFVFSEPDSTESVVEAKTTAKNSGYVSGRITTYWYSFDHQNYVVKYGKGYVMEETKLLEYRFIPKGATEDKIKQIRDSLNFLFSPLVRKVVTLYDISPLPLLKDLYMTYSLGRPKKSVTAELRSSLKVLIKRDTTEKLKTVALLLTGNENQGDIEVEKKVDFYNFPLVSNLPPKVIDSSKVTLDEIDQMRFMFSASLPPTCLELYSNIINTTLDEPSCLPDAIGYSINTEGCLLHTMIHNKKPFGGDEREVYLRVTLGLSQGQSPGIPYVLEIWPKKCRSPIHNHGNAYAVIKVLHGGLTIHVYNKNLQDHLTHLDVCQGDVTWISPNWYQAHVLHNDTPDYCATIQCYQYGKNDDISWPYFDFVDEAHNRIDEFLPDSDIQYGVMKKKVLTEYKQRK